MAPTQPSSGGAASPKPAPAPAKTDLITRYKLEKRVAAEQTEEKQGAADGNSSSGAKAKAWSANKDERQSLLQRRRDQMILDARKKMEAKMAAAKATAGKGQS